MVSSTKVAVLISFEWFHCSNRGTLPFQHTLWLVAALCRTFPHVAAGCRTLPHVSARCRTLPHAAARCRKLPHSTTNGHFLQLVLTMDLARYCVVRKGLSLYLYPNQLKVQHEHSTIPHFLKTWNLHILLFSPSKRKAYRVLYHQSTVNHLFQ